MLRLCQRYTTRLCIFRHLKLPTCTKCASCAEIRKISKVQYVRTSVIRILYYRFITRTRFTCRKFDSPGESLLTIDEITGGKAIQLQFNWENCCYAVAYVWVDVKCTALDKLWTTVETRYGKAIYYTYNKWKIILRQMQEKLLLHCIEY